MSTRSILVNELILKEHSGSFYCVFKDFGLYF